MYRKVTNVVPFQHKEIGICKFMWIGDMGEGKHLKSINFIFLRIGKPNDCTLLDMNGEKVRVICTACLAECVSSKCNYEYKFVQLIMLPAYIFNT